MVGIKRFLCVLVCAVSAWGVADETPAPAFVHVIWNKTVFPMGAMSGVNVTESETISKPSFRAVLKNRRLEYSSKATALDHGNLVIEGIRLSMKIEQIDTTAITVIDVPELRGFKVSTRREEKTIGLPTIKDPAIELNEIEKLTIALPERIDLLSTTKDQKTTWRLADPAAYEKAMRASLEQAITPELIKAATKPNLDGVPGFAKGPIENAVASFNEANVPKIREALLQWGLEQTSNEKILRAVSQGIPWNALPEGELIWSMQKEADGSLNIALTTGTVMPNVSGMKKPERRFEAIVISNEAGAQLLARCSARIAEDQNADPKALRILRGQDTQVKFESENGESWLTLSAALAKGETSREVEAAFRPNQNGQIELRALFAKAPAGEKRQLWASMFEQSKAGLESAVLKTLVSEELAKSQGGEQKLFVKFSQGSFPGAPVKERLLIVEYR